MGPDPEWMRFPPAGSSFESGGADSYDATLATDRKRWRWGGSDSLGASLWQPSRKGRSQRERRRIEERAPGAEREEAWRNAMTRLGKQFIESKKRGVIAQAESFRSLPRDTRVT